MYGIKENLPVHQKILVVIIVEAIRHRKFLWLATVAANYIASRLEVDWDKQTFKFKSEKAFDPTNTKIDYEDINKLLEKLHGPKLNPDDWKQGATEEHDTAGKFKRYSGETP